MKNFCVTLVMLLFALPAFAQHGATHETFCSTLDDFYSQCCGEFIDGTICMDVVRNANGDHARVSGDLVGRFNEISYTLRGVQQSWYILHENGADVQNVIVRARFENDEGCGFTVALNGHETVNANGETVVAWEETLTIVCDNGIQIE